MENEYMKDCKDCKLNELKCICDEVDAFFEDSWDLMQDDSWKAVMTEAGIKDVKVNN